MCENFVEEVDTVVKKEGDVAAALEKFCHEVLNFLIETCQKMILKNLKFIMERLQAHERSEKICIDLHYCANHTIGCR
ncbi:unnamed protein product [Cylicocyclus nassatus]|uniref:Saposin B-type domain-containing protein n=1 Tax=Cylicocyclus nassatus TaxID=53992 RepID=A0AA36DSQ7_CYLNA|nr:unnamed protein product [Cylicocyclus nassatus]